MLASTLKNTLFTKKIEAHLAELDQKFIGALKLKASAMDRDGFPRRRHIQGGGRRHWKRTLDLQPYVIHSPRKGGASVRMHSMIT